MYIPFFKPDAIEPGLLYNRQTELAWLVDSISTYLKDGNRDARRSLSFCVSGEKGVGKTILTKAALQKVRNEYSDRAIFVEADCRNLHTAKDIIDTLAQSVVYQLEEYRSAFPDEIPSELMDTAQILNTLTRFDEIELKEVHQHVVQFKAAASLKGDHVFLKALKLDFGIEVTRSSSASKELIGKVRFDELRLCKLLAALFEQIRRSGIDVVVYIDNIDEINHNYLKEGERDKARHETSILLRLSEAPVIFIVAMRTYYLGILPREMTNRCNLPRLGEKDLHGILQKRLEQLQPEARKVLDDPRVKRMVVRLARGAPTPLAFLTWFKEFFTADALTDETFEKGVTQYLERYYSTLPADVWRKVVAKFKDREVALTREDLLAACGGNEALFRQVVDRQAVLPKNFWDQNTYYTLDPELHLLHPDACPIVPEATS
jgi:Cdc6-like AAA superfamily ATPase